VPKGTGQNVKKYIENYYEMLNNWDVAQQFVGDIYSTWHIIALVCGLALRKGTHDLNSKSYLNISFS